MAGLEFRDCLCFPKPNVGIRQSVITSRLERKVTGVGNGEKEEPRVTTAFALQVGK